MDIWAIVMSVGMAVLGLGIWRLQTVITHAEKVRNEREEIREEHENLMLYSIGASLGLGEATARAIRDGRTNGDVTDALVYAEGIKHKQQEFIQKHGIKNIL